MQFTVAIDGPAAAGKGTLSRAVAKQFGFAHLDTGLLYRAVGRKVLDGTSALAAAEGLDEADLTRDDLRTPEVSQAASRVAALPDVRAALLAFQRRFAVRPGGAVLDGRDIGTVICPDAPVKLFVTATPEVRASRRYRELSAAGHTTDFATVLEDQRARDARDRSRPDAPLRAAVDAVVLDTSDMTIDTAVARAIAVIETKLTESER